ncbi:hypothetical protein QWY14_06960 [Planococcus sp. N028]|uniref:Uncharacterized protein n=1 Tax=Planococcus shixiaomingii TaxID=3058393 RepID=A0ABT8N0W5_9BACL|nr:MULTISPECIES: hypothetical protein [unclassified Planococcus (in: firmicutes)]MDN7241526.1 hypothetical protein [Planococcus sp. N028]WKA53776.1 hypothetical protein QWY21_14035 [Planococcus sp. N022]
MNGDLQFYAGKTEWSPWDEAAVLKMSYELRAELATTITCVGLLVDLSMDQHAIVRKGVALNPFTPITTLKRLAEQDLCSSVQDSAKKTLAVLTS